ncbi:MAG: ParB N-terminal domain-containing protein [Fidelibacterota bacterium]
MDITDSSIGTLPELAIVKIQQLKFHEQPDWQRVEKIIKSLRRRGQLKNPPVTTRIDKTAEYLIIDGANRVTALRILGYENILIQVVDLNSPDLVLSNWHHVLKGLKSDDLTRLINQVEGLTLKTRVSVAPEDRLFSIHFANGNNFAVLSDLSFEQKIDQLHQFFTLYHGEYFLDRVSYRDPERLHRVYNGYAALIQYQPLKKQQIITMVENNLLLPSGLTRFILPKRALGCNLDLTLLRGQKTDQERRKILTQFLAQKLRDNKIRFYHEPTFHFDN